MVIVGTETALIVIESACISVFELPSATWTVKFDVPTVVGVPEISPVELFKLRPAGKLPATIDHV